MSVASVPARHNAVEKVNTAFNRLKNIDRCADTHKIPDLVLWHMRFNGIDDPVHILSRFADSKTAYCIPVKVKLSNLFHMLNTKIIKGASLIYAEQHLIRVDTKTAFLKSHHFGFATNKPTSSTLTRLL